MEIEMKKVYIYPGIANPDCTRPGGVQLHIESALEFQLGIDAAKEICSRHGVEFHREGFGHRCYAVLPLSEKEIEAAQKLWEEVEE